MEDKLEKSISLLIADQFPEWYRQEGPTFVAFVREYYKWLESRTNRREKYLRRGKSSIAVTHNSANIVGSNTFFTEHFSNGDYIIIDKKTDDGDYEIFQIDTVANNTFLTLNTSKLPQFASTNTAYGTANNYGNPLYYARRMPEIIDIDETLDEFLIQFKQQYLNDIQFDTITNTRTLVKHALDIYRAKGTERAVDLLFRVVFGVGAKIYYPSKDLFRTSSGTWYRPNYLELSPHENTVKFTDRQIQGIKSGATAFVESVIRRTVAGRIVDVAFISAINGSFQTGEKIIAPTLPTLSVEEVPHIVGSLNRIRVPAGGVGNSFTIGDVLTVVSEQGREARARVANTANTTGELSINLVSGGYGFTVNAAPIISTVVLNVANVSPNTSSSLYFGDSEVVYQPYANIVYTSSNGTPTVGTEVRSYDGANTDGYGKVIAIEETNTSHGTIRTSVISGNLQTGNAIYFGANAIGANISSYADHTATGNVVGYTANVILTVNAVSGTFTANEVIQGATANGRVSTLGIVSNGGILGLTGSQHIFTPGETITGVNSGATAVVAGIAITLGVKDTSNDFISSEHNYIYGTTLSGNGTVTRVSNGSGTSFSFSNSLLYEESLSFANELLDDYDHIALNAATYGMTGDPSGNLTSNTIENMLSFTTWNIGKLQAITSFNPGSDYNVLPVIRIREPFIANYRIFGQQILHIANVSSSFAVGEYVDQEDLNSRGIVVAANNTHLVVERLRFFATDSFAVTTNATTMITGADTGASANVTYVGEVNSSEYLGNNVILSFDVTVSNGAITELEVIDSGYAFNQGETVNAYSNNMSIEGVAVLETHGTGSGFYYDTGGFLSDNKKLFDGIYWQEYSYEIRSSVQLNRYVDMLRKVLHVAGTQYFGNLIHTSTTTVSLINANTQIAIS